MLLSSRIPSYTAFTAWASPSSASRAGHACSIQLVERRAAEPVLPLRLFRNRVFSAASAIGLVTGFAMFGALTYLPQYMQIVKGASPTSSGLRLLPMMAGLLLTSIGTGQLVTRWGRYRSSRSSGPPS